MTGSVLQFRVAGTPVTQGNHSAWAPKGAKFARVVDTNQRTLRPWREAIRSTAVDAAGEEWQPLAGPVRVDVWLALPKPSSAPKTRRTWPIGARSGDADKLARAVLDALTDAGVWRDDSQVVELRVVKDYPEHVQQLSPGALVRIWRVDGELPPLTTGQIPVLTEGKTTA